MWNSNVCLHETVLGSNLAPSAPGETFYVNDHETGEKAQICSTGGVLDVSREAFFQKGSHLS